MSRVCLYRYSSLDAWSDGLADSDVGGRVVLKDAEGTQENSDIKFYSPADLKILEEVRKGNLAPKELEKIINRFS